MIDKTGLTDADARIEEHLLACVIMDPRTAIPAVATEVSGRDFMDPVLGKAFDATLNLFHAGRPVFDVALLAKDWEAMKIDPKVASLAFAVRLTFELPSSTHALLYAEQVRDRARLMRLREAGLSLEQKAGEKGATPEEVLAWLEGQMLVMRQGTAARARRIGQVWKELVDDLEARVDKPDGPAMLSGLPSADHLGLVFVPGELTVLAARPGVGKTSFATQIAMHHASLQRSVLIASLEMRDKELSSRILIPAAGYNHQVIRTGRIDRQCITDLRQAGRELGDLPLFIWSPGRVRAGAIHATAAVLKASSDLRLLVVDYIGLVLPDDRSRSRHEQVGEIVKALRGIAQQLEIPVIALCQLNREADKQRPTLGNLRESGDIEQDADIVAALHREKDDAEDVELLMLKNRQGTIGGITLKWRKEQTLFAETGAEDMSNYNRELAEWSK